ncbi:MAG TPA: heme transporter, partial [Polyangiaceae bacterium]
GVYWAWEPRLVTTLLSVLIYIAVVVLRAFAGDGEAERKFAAALGVLGTFNLPVIHYSVQKWGGNHPTVIAGKGGGLGDPDMKLALGVGFFAMTLLCGLLLWVRARLALSTTRLTHIEELAAARGLGDAE